jgi:hypothetical protein
LTRFKSIIALENSKMIAPPRVRALIYAPLLAHVIPTLAIGFGIVIPGSCIAGVNQLTIGFAATVLGLIPAYVVGVRLAQRRAPAHA